MSINLYLIETKARSTYVCPGCKGEIPKGALHFRHDPHPYARQFRGQPTTHWCRDCVTASQPGGKDPDGRIRVPAFRVLGRPLTERAHIELARGERDIVESDLPLFRPLQTQLVRIGEVLLGRLAQDPAAIHALSPTQFEEFVCDRLFAMGFEPRQVGSTNRKDGGIDIVFWPRQNVPFPFLGAAQVKHHRSPRTREGSRTVRDFAGAIQNHPFNAGVIVTNTAFTPDARWFAAQRGLADAVTAGHGTRAMLVLGGDGWTLRDYFTSGKMSEHLIHAGLVKVVTLEAFIRLANNGHL